MFRPLAPFTRTAQGLAVALAAALLSGGAGVAQDGGSALEQATKAAMIYNFGRFTTWPNSRFDRPDDPVVVCIDPSDPLAPALAGINGKQLGARVLVVRRTPRIDHSCDMAYIAAAAASDGFLSSLADRGVLTIGEAPSFSRSGAIKLVTIGRQVRFEINQQVATAAGAHLSSNLLRLAVAVR
jgi:hypothetical protein